MDINCCNSSGGRVIITANGKRWSARSAVTVNPTQIERKAEANQDGTLAVQTKPVPAEAEFTLSDRCGLSVNDIMGCPVDVTIELVDMRRRYFFTAAVVIGRPSINSETGEIRGLKVTSNQVQEVNY